MKLLDRVGQRRIDQSADNRLHERAIEREIGLRHAVDCFEAMLVGSIIAAKRSNVVEGARLAAHHPVAAGEIGTCSFRRLGFEKRLIEPRRQCID
jgi:hypothetical protein